MLAVDTEEVAVLEASLHPMTEAPPAFPEEPAYAPPAESPPDIDQAEYLRLLPSVYSLHTSSRLPSPEPLPIPPPRTGPLPQDNLEDPCNRVHGLSDLARERLFYSTTGLAAAELMLARQEEAEHPLVLDPDTNVVHRVATLLSTPSNTSMHSTPATTADSLPSHCKYPFHAACGTERISCFGLPRSRDRIPQIRRVQPPTPPHQSPFVPRFPHSFLFSPTMNPLRYIFFLAFGIASQGSP
jgi:hypothetical protein